MRDIRQEILKGERAFYAQSGARLYDCVFCGGESAVKECSDIEINRSVFEWKYPVWYGRRIAVDSCTFLKDCRAGFWYINELSVKNSVIDAPKCIRRCSDVTLENVSFTDGDETLWACRGARLKNVTAKGSYFAMNCTDVDAQGLDLVGGYSFDGVKNTTIRNSKIVGRDAFWNSENVTVYDSFLTGEYLAWNARNVTFINCTIESLQGLCYIDELKMRGCRLINTTLAFEYADVDAQIDGTIDSVFNPKSGTITADRIGELTVDRDRVDPGKTRIICKG